MLNVVKFVEFFELSSISHCKYLASLARNILGRKVDFSEKAGNQFSAKF